MSEPDPPQADELERAVAALIARPVPGYPAGLTAAIVAAVETRVAEARRARRRRRIMRYATICGVAVLVAAGAGVWGGGGSARASLLKALENQARAATVRGTSRVTFADPPPGAPAEIRMTFYAEGARVRFENGAAVSVGDGKRMVVFNAAAKTATLMRMPAGAAPPQSDLAKEMAAAVRKMIESAGGRDKVMPAAPAEIGSKARPGFRVTGAEVGGRKADVTYWLDEERVLPLRLEMTTAEPFAMTGVTDFVYGEVIDPKLFSLDIPADYAVSELEVPAKFDPAKPGEVPAPKVVRPAPAKVAPPVADGAPATDAERAALVAALASAEGAKSYRMVHTLASEGFPPTVEQKFHRDGRTRAESQYLTNIYDGKRSLTLIPSTKVAKVMEFPGGVAGTAPSEAAQWAALARRGVEQGAKVTATPPEDVQGAERPGLKVSGIPHGKDQAIDMTYWLDAKTRLPLRLRYAVAGPPPITVVHDYIAFGEALEAKLFDQAVPAGYKLETEPPAAKPGK